MSFEKLKTGEARVKDEPANILEQAKSLFDAVATALRVFNTTSEPPTTDPLEPMRNASTELKRACVLVAVESTDRVYAAWLRDYLNYNTTSDSYICMRAAESVLRALLDHRLGFSLAEIERIASSAVKDGMLLVFPVQPLVSLLTEACERLTPTPKLAECITLLAEQQLKGVKPNIKAGLRRLVMQLHARGDVRAVGSAHSLTEPESYIIGTSILDRVLSKIDPPTIDHQRLNPTRFADDPDAGIVQTMISIIDALNGRKPKIGISAAVLATPGFKSLNEGPVSQVHRSLVYCSALTALLRSTPIPLPTEENKLSRAYLCQYLGATGVLCVLGEALIPRAASEAPTPEIAEELLLAAQMAEYRDLPTWIGPQVFELIEMTFKAAQLSKRVRAVATELRAYFARSQSGPVRHITTRLDNMLGVSPELLDRADRFAAEAINDLAAMPPERRDAWRALLEHALAATGSKPSAKWLKACDGLIQNVGDSEFAERVSRWFSLVGKKPDMPEGMPEPTRDLTVPLDTNSQALKGLVLMCARFDNSRMAGTLGDLALVSFKMVPGVGARCIKVGTACIWSLSEMQGAYAAAQLSRARQLVKFGSARKWLDQAIDRVAFAAGLTADELQEVCTPDYDLSRDEASFATRRVTLGDFTAELAITGTSSAEIRIMDERGVQRKSVPAAIKKNHSVELKSLQESAKDIEKMLPAQRDRLERLMADERAWPFGTWRERYIDHPLVGPAARRLIWRFAPAAQSTPHAARSVDAEATLGMVHEGKVVGIDRAPLAWLNDAGEAARRRIAVTLWRPLGAEPRLVAAWRQALDDNGITQPFKQAHREVYLLTDAERRTRTYSNRFAAHIVRYPQLTKLAQDRGWNAGTLVIYDSSYCKNPMIKLPRWDIGAELFVEGAGDETTPAGIYSYAQTDQVRFFSLRAPAESLPLEQVPALVFSEVMRDVDLFVAVASVGNDPTWQDQGERASEQFSTYWQQFAWGELSIGAQTRREMLEKLLPRLAIGDRCRLMERYLVVQGSLRRYKIHLGSGNILMEPNDQYLCIVPKSATMGEAAAAAVRLPFEGDRTLTVILSKAFMLADDAKITDPTITSQIRT